MYYTLHGKRFFYTFLEKKSVLEKNDRDSRKNHPAFYEQIYEKINEGAYSWFERERPFRDIGDPEHPLLEFNFQTETSNANVTYNTETLLTLSTRLGHHYISKILIEHGADPLYRGVGFPSDTPMEAILSTHDPDLFKLFLEKSLDELRWKHSCGKYVVDSVFYTSFKETIASRRYTGFQMAKVALEFGKEFSFTVNTKSVIGETLLNDVVAKTKNIEIIEFMLNQGAEINSRGWKGRTALVVACQRGFLEIVCFLLSKGADVHLVDSENRTALYYCFELLFKSLQIENKTLEPSGNGYIEVGSEYASPNSGNAITLIEKLVSHDASCLNFFCGKSVLDQEESRYLESTMKVGKIAALFQGRTPNFFPNEKKMLKKDNANNVNNNNNVARGQVRVGRIKTGKDSVERFKKAFPKFKPLKVMAASSDHGMLSPFCLKNEKGYLIENVWQFSKVYEEIPTINVPKNQWDSTIVFRSNKEVHVDSRFDPNERYWEWRKRGKETKYPIRYPVGLKVRRQCLYSIKDDNKDNYDKTKRLGYIQSRKEIYLPIYFDAVKKEERFKEIKKNLEAGQDYLILEVDGPREESLPYYMKKYGVGESFIKEGTMLATEKNLKIFLNDEEHPFGHGFCLAAALLDIDLLKEDVEEEEKKKKKKSDPDEETQKKRKVEEL